MSIKKSSIEKVNSNTTKKFWDKWELLEYLVDFRWRKFSFKVKQTWNWYVFVKEKWLIELLKVLDKKFEDISWKIFKYRCEVSVFMEDLLSKINYNKYYYQILSKKVNIRYLIKKINSSWIIQINEKEVKSYNIAEKFRIDIKKFWTIYFKDIIKTIEKNFHTLEIDIILKEAYNSFLEKLDFRKNLISYFWVSIDKLKLELKKIKYSWKEPKIFLECKKNLKEINKIKEKLKEYSTEMFEAVFNDCYNTTF